MFATASATSGTRQPIHIVGVTVVVDVVMVNQGPRFAVSIRLAKIEAGSISISYVCWHAALVQAVVAIVTCRTTIAMLQDCMVAK